MLLPRVNWPHPQLIIICNFIDCVLIGFREFKQCMVASGTTLFSSNCQLGGIGVKGLASMQHFLQEVYVWHCKETMK